MKYLVTAEEMKRYDTNTITCLGIPGVVLMERAALAALDVLKERFEAEKSRPKVLIFAGMGNNGGDGLALARLLAEQGYVVTVRSVGDKGKASKQWQQQWEILKHFPVETDSITDGEEYTVIVDALFGVGLSRDVQGCYAEAVAEINRRQGFKLALDVPSGICSDTGAVLGCAVKADVTVTFGFCKRGLVLYPGAVYAGKVITAKIGIDSYSFYGREPELFAYDEAPESLMPVRDPAGNKGTFGKVLLVAGSYGMAGAAILAAKAACRSGAGMVKVITDERNRAILQQSIPEVLYGSPGQLEEALEWTDVICAGPGLGQSDLALRCMESVVQGNHKPLLLDADALNLLSNDRGKALRKELEEQAARGRILILTPHVGELSRLLSVTIPECKEALLEKARLLAKAFHGIVVAKDARTIICRESGQACLNLSGNSGMATAGSGDVLAGLISGLLAQHMESFQAACAGVYLHGCAGDLVAAEHSEHACMAGDLADQIGRSGR